MPALAILIMVICWRFDFVSQAWKNTKVIERKDEYGNDIVTPQVKPVVGCEFYVVKDRFEKVLPKKKRWTFSPGVTCKK